MFPDSTSNIRSGTPEKLVGPLNDIEKKFAPAKLYFIGNEELLSKHPRVSIIGTRKPSERAKEYTHSLTTFLVVNKCVIVSGLAKGIDSIAHRTAIDKKGDTIAVLGNPLDTYYPEENRILQDKIMKDHLLISQFPIGSAIQRKNFPIRNRTMALLSDASIIVEASKGSGTIHQGWEALRLGRPLYIIEDEKKENDLGWASDLIKYGAEIVPISQMKIILESLPTQIEMVIESAPF
ncbi:MAG: DNA-protecting protein DprA [Nanoarchaeota archaeon]|nr:DNA-protecting protein DprA [Nanoarchaeota archaeon]